MMQNGYFESRLLFLLCFVLCLLIFNNLKAAPSGKIVGTVTDEATGKVLPGANCVIKGTSMGSSSDMNGDFRIFNVPPGKYSLVFTYIGYRQFEKEIVVSVGKTTRLDITLKPSVLEYDEAIVITAQREGQVEAINRQLTADAIKNVVAAERIQEVPDANAAESISRLPGISLIRSAGEGAKVVVRGLSPKYSKIMINGVAVPSTDEDDRSSDLSMVSPENLSGIEVLKALTPDMEADAIGGVVNLQLAKAKEKPERIVRIYGAYNAQEKDFRQYKAFFKWSQRLFNNKIGLQASVNSEYRNRSSDYLSADYVLSAPKEDGTVPLRMTGATVGDREEYRKRYGGTLILDYDYKYWSFMLSNFYSKTSRDSRIRTTGYTGNNMNATSSINNPIREIELISNAFKGEGLIKGMQMDWSLAHSYTENNQLHSTPLKFLQDNARLPDVDFETVNPANFVKDIIPDSTASVQGASYSDNAVQERSYVAGVNFKIPYQLSPGISGELKFGGRYRHNERFKDQNAGDWWVYLDLETYPISDFYDSDYDPGEFLNGKSNLGIILDPTLTYPFYKEHKSNYTMNETDDDDYEALDQISAAYLMTKLKFGQLITFIPGVRYEQLDGDYKGYLNLSLGHGAGIYEPQNRAFVQKNWLPMFHLKVKPNDWFDFRFAVTRSLTRPDFKKLLPRLKSSLNQLTAGVSQGNPDLKPAKSWNYDAYVSIYHHVLGLFTVGYFYKDIDDIVINTKRFIDSQETAKSVGLDSVFYRYNAGGNVRELTYVGRRVNRPENGPKSTAKGFEIDLQTNFAYLPGFLKGIVINANYSRIWSETNFPYFKIETIIDRTKFPPKVQTNYITGTRKGRIPGQAEYIANLMVGYDIGGLSARISMTYQGESLSGTYTQEERDSWDRAFTRWSLSVRQTINEHFSLFLNGVNLTNKSEGAYLGNDPRPTDLDYYGAMYDFGVQYRF